MTTPKSPKTNLSSTSATRWMFLSRFLLLLGLMLHLISEPSSGSLGAERLLRMKGEGAEKKKGSLSNYNEFLSFVDLQDSVNNFNTKVSISSFFDKVATVCFEDPRGYKTNVPCTYRYVISKNQTRCLYQDPHTEPLACFSPSVSFASQHLADFWNAVTTIPEQMLVTVDSDSTSCPELIHDKQIQLNKLVLDKCDAISWGFGTTGWWIKDKRLLLQLEPTWRTSTLQVDQFFGRSLNNCKYYWNLFNHHAGGKGKSFIEHRYAFPEFQCGNQTMDEPLLPQGSSGKALRDCNHNFYFDRWKTMGVSGSYYEPASPEESYCLG